MQAVEAVLAHAEAVMEIRRLAHDVYTCWQEVKGERQHSGETVTTVRLTVSPVRLQMGDATKEWIECAHDLAKALVAFESAKASDDDDDAAVGGDDDDGESGDGSDEEGGGGRRKRRGEVRTRWAAPQNRALDRFAHWVRVLGEDSVLRAGLDAEDYLVDLDEDADISPAVSEAEATRRASITKYSVSARVYVDGRHVTTTGEMPLEWPTYTVPTLQGAPRTIRIRLLHQPKSVELALMWRWKPQQRVLGADRIAIVALPLPAAATESGVAAAASSAAQASVRWVADRPIPVKNWTWQPFGMGGVNSFATQRFVNGTVAAALSWSRRGVLPPPPPSGGGPLTTTADAEAAAHAMWSMQLHDLARERSTLKSGIGALNPNDPRDAPLMKQVEQGGGSGFSAVEGGAAAAANRSDALVRSVFRESAYVERRVPSGLLRSFMPPLSVPTKHRAIRLHHRRPSPSRSHASPSPLCVSCFSLYLSITRALFLSPQLLVAAEHCANRRRDPRAARCGQPTHRLWREPALDDAARGRWSRTAPSRCCTPTFRASCARCCASSTTNCARASSAPRAP